MASLEKMTKSQLIEKIIRLEKQLDPDQAELSDHTSGLTATGHNCLEVIFQLPEDVVMIDRNLKIVDVNKSVLVNSGLQRKDMIGRFCYEILYGCRMPCVHQGESCKIREVFKAGGSIRSSHKQKCADGSSVMVDILLFPFKDNHGKVLYVLEIMRDITDFLKIKKQANIAGKKAQQYLDVVGVLIVALDTDGNVTLVNRKGCEILERKETEIIGRNWFAHFIPKRNIREVKSLFRQTVKGKYEFYDYYENPVITKSGQEKMIAWYSSVLRDESGKVTGTLSSGTDITLRKQTENALKKALIRNEAILSAVPDIIMEVDKFKKYTWANQEGLKFFGEDVIGREASSYFIGKQDTYRTVQPLFEGSDDITYVESWQRRKDGESRLLAWWCRNLKNEGGEIIGALSTARDITEQRTAEERIVRDLHEKELLLKEIHHRVKNNLQIIISLLNLQSHYVKDPLIYEVLQNSRNRIYSMALVHQKLYESSDFTDIDFKPYVKGIVRELSHALDIKDQIRINVEMHDVELGIDLAVPCGLIINELITNAMKHAFPGNRRGKITITLTRMKNDRFELSVRDNGIGIEKKIDLKKIKTLGLQLVRILVDQIQGKLKIVQEQGLDFRIRFRRAGNH